VAVVALEVRFHQMRRYFMRGRVIGTSGGKNVGGEGRQSVCGDIHVSSPLVLRPRSS
jgi:hypothetical protein